LFEVASRRKRELRAPWSKDGDLTLCSNVNGSPPMALAVYACSTLPGLNTRKYHGLLVAAMAPPVRRMVLLSRVEETLWHNGRPICIGLQRISRRHLPPGPAPPGANSSPAAPRDGFTPPKDGASEKTTRPHRRLQHRPADLQAPGKAMQSISQLRPLMALRPIHNLKLSIQRPPRHRRARPQPITALPPLPPRPKSSFAPRRVLHGPAPTGTSTRSTAASKNAGYSGSKISGPPVKSDSTSPPTHV